MHLADLLPRCPQYKDPGASRLSRGDLEVAHRPLEQRTPNSAYE